MKISEYLMAIRPMKTTSLLHWALFLISVLFFTGCDQSELDMAESNLLPNIEDINKTICNGLDPESVEISPIRIPYFQDQYTIDITEMQRCGMHMQLEMLNTKIGSSASSSGQYFTATSIGLKAAGFDIHKDYKTSGDTLGKYMEVLNEGEFFGIVYASNKDNRSISGYFFGISEQRKEDVFSLIRLSERKFYIPTADIN